jgi:hypothetical protein
MSGFTPEEIAAMAKGAGFGMQMAMLDHPYCQADAQRLYQQLERFAQLVADKAAARATEAAAQVCESFKQGNAATYIDDDWADMCAAAIRARGQKGVTA